MILNPIQPNTLWYNLSSLFPLPRLLNEDQHHGDADAAVGGGGDKKWKLIRNLTIMKSKKAQFMLIYNDLGILWMLLEF